MKHKLEERKSTLEALTAAVQTFISHPSHPLPPPPTTAAEIITTVQPRVLYPERRKIHQRHHCSCPSTSKNPPCSLSRLPQSISRIACAGLLVGWAPLASVFKLLIFEAVKPGLKTNTFHPSGPYATAWHAVHVLGVTP